MDRPRRGPPGQRAVSRGRCGNRDADLCRPAALHPGLGRLPGPRRGAARRPGRRPPAGPARLRHRPGQHPRGRPGGDPAGPRRSGRRSVPGARRGPAAGGRVRLRRRPAAGPARARAAGQIIWAERTWPQPGPRACGHPGRRVPGPAGSSCARAGPPARPRASCCARISYATSPRAWPATTGWPRRIAATAVCRCSTSTPRWSDCSRPSPRAHAWCWTASSAAGDSGS